MRPTPAIATVPDDFTPLAARTIAENPRAVMGNNLPTDNDNDRPPLVLVDNVFTEINDLFAEATHWADGEPIADEATAAAITKLYDGLHAAGKRADELRIGEKKPHDDAAAAVQARYNPFIQPKKGRVDLGKAALSDLLSVWRTAKAKAAASEAARIAQEAAAATLAAQEAIRASSGNLAGRVEAEELLAHAGSLQKAAARADKQATTGTGLRTVWVAEFEGKANSAEMALEWAYTKDANRFTELVQQMADEAVRTGTRTIPGYIVKETKVASAGRS